jgi:hypothetical protein
MTRKLLVAATSALPLILAAAAAQAQLSITSSTSTPIATATASNGAPANIDIASGGSVSLTASGTAVTLNSNNSITLEGAINSTGVNGVTGLLINGGYTGSFVNTGTINLTESTIAPTDTNTGVLEGPFAQGNDRTGILVSGSSPFNGSITQTGSISVTGQTSYGIDIQTPITGALLMQTVSPTTFTSSTTVTVANGSVTMTGENSTGLYVAPTGGVGGNVIVTGVTATGTGSKAVEIDGAVGGGITVAGAVTATGYRTTARSSVPQIEMDYTAAELTQGGAAFTVGGSVAGGLIVSAPPPILSSTNPDLDGNGVPDAQQSSGELISYGSAPALQLGIATQSGTMGLVGPGNGEVTALGTPDGGNMYGLVLEGTVIGNSLFDPVTSPNLTSILPATAIQIGTGNTNYTYTIQGGIYNTGIITAEAYQASATAIHFVAGGSTPLIVNSGQIGAVSNQETTISSGFAPVNVYGILIDSGAVVNKVVNNGAVISSIIGYQGAGATELGGIIDRSGTLTSVVNTGEISATANQTVLAEPMPIGSAVAIDMSQSTAPQSITQSVNTSLPANTAYAQSSTYTAGQYVNYQNNVYEAIAATVTTGEDPVDYPSAWKEIGALTPSINGDIYFGNGGSTLTVTGGTINAPVINLGTGVNTITVAGAAGSGTSGATVTGAIEEGSLIAAGHSTLTINVNNGTLSDTNPNALTANSVSVGANGLLLVAADPANGTNTLFTTSGASVFANGAGLGLTLLSLPSTLQETFVILQTTGAGTLTAGTFAPSVGVVNAPYLFTATPAYVPQGTAGGGELTLTVTEKTPRQLGLETAEGQALSAVIAAAGAAAAATSPDTTVETALLSPTTEAGFKTVYDQLLPNQGQGLFDALDAASQSISEMTSTNPDNGQQVAGTSLWLQEVNENVKREGLDSPASYTKLTGLVAGIEHLGEGGGSLGATLSFMSANELPAAQQTGSGLNGQIIEASLYYRRAVGGLTLSARGGIGVVFFTDQRTFIDGGSKLAAKGTWDALLYDGHVSVAYEHRVLGNFYARPELAMDYLGLNEEGYSESGGGSSYDLTLAARNSNRLTTTAGLTLGHEWGKDAWLRSEMTLGYMDVVYGNIGDTVANFTGGAPFSMSPDGTHGGWAVVGLSLKAGSASSYFALEGHFEYRHGEQIYDLGLAGRSIF